MAMHEVNIQRLLNELTKEEQEKLTRREEIDVPLWSIVNQHNDETIDREHEKILNRIDDLMKKHGIFQKEDQSVTLKWKDYKVIDLEKSYPNIKIFKDETIKSPYEKHPNHKLIKIKVNIKIEIEQGFVDDFNELVVDFNKIIVDNFLVNL